MAYKKLIVANWKMNPSTIAIATSLFEATKEATHGKRHLKAITLAPYPFVVTLAAIKNTGNCLVGAQDFFAEPEGAYTGEVSVGMIKSVGAQYVVLGHSERRARGEDDALVNKKIKVALDAKITPIVAIGEHERDAEGNYIGWYRDQLLSTLAHFSKDDIARMVLAYEPVWAISTTKNARKAQPEDCFEMITFTRKVLADVYKDHDLAQEVPILYGGSVNAVNAEGFLVDGGADGLLVGSASLRPTEWKSIIDSAEVAGKMYAKQK